MNIASEFGWSVIKIRVVINSVTISVLSVLETLRQVFIDINVKTLMKISVGVSSVQNVQNIYGDRTRNN